MSKKVYLKGTISYRMEKGHPDWDCVKDHRKRLSFYDIYQFDTDWFPSYESMESHMKHDLKLVAGGGYSTDYVKKVRYQFDVVSEKEYEREQEEQRKRIEALIASRAH